MIHVFFVPGMFGSTIEYVLRNYTKEYPKNYKDYPKNYKEILPDGSMHTFKKEHHPLDPLHLNLAHLTKNSIVTPIYPFKRMHLEDILKNYSFALDDSRILVHADNLESAELNCLFQYHKIAIGSKMNLGLEIFCGSNESNITAWNKCYSSWKDMQQWELREWFSIFYPSWVKEWTDSPGLLTDDWKVFSNAELLNYPVAVFRQIINFCNLTEDNDLIEFANKWRAAQQYVVDEFDLLNQIVDKSLTQKEFDWRPINIIAEAIVQQKLRSKGYEIMCDGLNIFPTSSEDLYKRLIKV
jgi:hypothetical protein